MTFRDLFFRLIDVFFIILSYELGKYLMQTLGA